MKKFINNVDDLLINSLQGFAHSHADVVQLHTNPTVISRTQAATSPKVALISGGGAGHEPLHSGFVGKGMLDAACPGQIFTSPTPDQMLTAAQSTENGKGVLFIVKNYAGDVMNFEIAAEMLDCPNATVLVNDDVSIERAHSAGRRGVAGTLIVEKIIGAAAESGLSLEECQALGQSVNAATASLGVALSSCTVPAIGKPTFDIRDDEMEVGIGIHGERGRATAPLGTASEIAESLTESLVTELDLTAGQEVLLHINGFGATPLMELYLMYQLAQQYLQQGSISVVRSLVGNYTTSLDMAGCSITLTKLDQQMLQYWDDPVHTASLKW